MKLRCLAWLKSTRILLIIIPILLFLPTLISGKVVYWGTASLQFIPWRVLAYQELGSGIWAPLWNPYNGMGAPLLANYQLAWFYPPSWVLGIFYWIGKVPGLAIGFTCLLPAHLFLAGLGMAQLTRRMGLNDLAQTVSGLAFGLCGYVVARGSFFSMVWAYAWLPWILDQASKVASPFSEDEVKTPSQFLPPGLVFVMAMQLLAGHAQITWYSLMLCVAWVALGGWFRGKWRGGLTALLRIGLCGLMAGCIAAIQLLPTTEYLMLSQRAASYDPSSAMTYSFWPWRIITLVAPDFFGNPGRGDYWGYAAYWEDAIYLGVLPLLLAITAMVNVKKNGRKYRGLIWFLLTVIFLAFILALGRNTPAFPLLFAHVPTFDMFQAPARYLIWAACAIAILSGVGAHIWRRPGKRGLRWLRIALAGSMAVVIGAGLALVLMAGGAEKSSIYAVVGFGVLCAGSALLAMKAPWEGQSDCQKNKWNWAVCAWISVDLLLAGFWLNPGIEWAIFRPQTAVRTTGRVYLTKIEEYSLKFGKYLSFSDLRPTPAWNSRHINLIPDLNILDGVSMTGNFDPIVSERYATWMDVIENMSTRRQNCLLGMMGVSLIETQDPYGGNMHYAPLEGSQRVQWYGCANAAHDPGEALDRVLYKIDQDDFILSNSCVEIEGLAEHQPSQNAPGQFYLSDFQDRFSTINFTVETKTEGWVVLADLWYPYWKATIDGHPVQIYPANYLFKGIFVPAGKHQIEFQYQPLWYQVGVGISLAGVILWAILYLKWFGRGKHYGKQT